MKPKFEEKFNEKLNLFKEYVEEFHELPSVKTVYKDVQLGQWIQNQKTFLKSGKLSEERIKMLNVVNPFWNASTDEKKIENQRLLLSSDWKSKVPEGNHPLDTIYEGEELYTHLSRNIYDIETLIKSNYYDGLDILNLYSKIISIDPNYALLLCAIYGFNVSSNGFDASVEFFNRFIFTNKEEMIEKMNQMLNFHRISPRARLIIDLRFGLNDRKCLFLSQVGEIMGISRDRVRQIEAKTLRHLRHPENKRIIEKTNTVLDNLHINIRMKLYHAGIDTVEKIQHALKSYIITDHEIRAELEKLLASLEKENNIKMPEDILQSDIGEIIQEVRAYNCLKRAGINTIAQLKELCDDHPNKLCKIRNMGRRSIDHILTKLNEALGSDYQLDI